MTWIIAAPELYFLFTAAVFFTFAMISRPNAKRDYITALVLALPAVLVTLACVKLHGGFSQFYRVDLFSQIFKVLLAMGFFLIVCICLQLHGIREERHPEFYLLLSVCTLAMMVLVSSVDLLTIYVSLELSSYSLYILVALRKGNGHSLEGGIKYFLMGAAVSAIMLFGMALLYGACGETNVSAIANALSADIASPMLVIGLMLTLCGFFFKLAVFPFHFWAPGVYQGAANQVTAYIATATKAAAVALLLRFATVGAESVYLVHILVALAIASMTLGNLAAIGQKDLKRLLAYSTVAQAGYILIGILCMSESGFAAAIFYAAAYLMMNFICFVVVVKVGEQGGNVLVSGLAGLHRRSPLLAVSIMAGVFSLGGLPPTAGFTGKFLVFTAAMEKGYFYLVLIGMLNVLVSLYYYVLVVKAAYFLDPEEPLPAIELSFPTKLLLVAIVISLLVGGMYPDIFYGPALAAARALAG
ncbi:MAG: NADH-quinone oxidoreductase subunit N [Deltaproteobacteria bacterium]|nr:NADH-quinone oxidoreductase subunit N [Deltaproteobacteria bacterium]